MFRINELDSATEALRSELVTSRSELESVKLRSVRELADKDTVLVTARRDRDAAVGRADSVNRMNNPVIHTLIFKALQVFSENVSLTTSLENTVRTLATVTSERDVALARVAKLISSV
jgi:hypothetical protein